MMNFWQGKRVRLRGVEPSDADFFIAGNLDSERGRSLDFLWPPVSAESVRAWTAEVSKQKLENGAFHWVIENVEGAAAGSIDTHHCDPRAGTFRYGIEVRPAFRRRGLAREAVQLVLKYYFEELRYQKVTISVHADNAASIAFHESLGFQLEGTLRRMVFTHGGHVDERWYGMTVEEFRMMKDEWKAE